MNITNHLTKGGLQFEDGNIHKVGSDNTYQFKNIKLLNDAHPIISPDDHVIELNLLKKHKGKTSTKKIVLPSCILTQAREGNKILFSQEEKNFELKLHPELLNGVKWCCNKEFLYLSEDVPAGHHLWSKKKGITLSPNAESIQIGKTGCSPLNFNTLKRIKENAEKCHEDVRTLPLTDRMIISLPISGYLDEQQDPDMNIYHISIDLIVDSDRLYVHSYPNKKSMLNEQYYFINLEQGSQKIDKNKILAKQSDERLEIELPYIKQPSEKTIPVKKGEWNWEAELSENDESESEEIYLIQDEPSNDKCCISCVVS